MHQNSRALVSVKWPILLFCPLLAFVGCSKSSTGPAPVKAVEVSVTPVAVEAVPVAAELPGRVVAPRVAHVRARATGILLKRYFEEGAEVKEGDVLFQIDPAPLEATRDAAQAALAKAEATRQETKLKAERYVELVKVQAVSQQDGDSAVAADASQAAEVQSARAALKTAELNLGYTKVTAPISGRIGKALVTEGALVSATELTELAVIRQMEPIYVDFTQASTTVLKLRRAVAAGKVEQVSDGSIPVTLRLEDGSTYEHQGRLLFSEMSVDETTGMVTLRAEVSNPERLLLPGMFVRVRVAQAIDQKALTVPQRSAMRNADGTATVLVVNAQHQIESRTITADTAVGDKWIVTAGLQAGETIVVEGLQKVRAGSLVTTVPFTTATAGQAAASGGNAAAASEGGN